MATRWTAYTQSDLRGAVAPTYKWASPGMLNLPAGYYNAQTMPLNSQSHPIFGIGVANYNWTPRNVHGKIDTLRREQNQEAGGSAQIWRAMNTWATSRKSKQSDLFLSYLRSGKVPAGLTMDTIMNAGDHALRETARGQQHKGGGFLGTLGNVLKTAAPAIVGSILAPGIGTALGVNVSAAAGGALAGGIAGGIRGGVKGAALGGLSGYGIGSGIGSAKSFLAAKSAAAGQPFHAGALGLSNSALHPASLAMYPVSSLPASAGAIGLGAGKGFYAPAGLGLGNTEVAKFWANSRAASANAVPGASTGIRSARPGMGGGLTTAQGAGTAPLSTAPQTGVNRAIINSSLPRAPAPSPASLMGLRPSQLYNPVALGGQPGTSSFARGIDRAVDTYENLRQAGLLTGGQPQQTQNASGGGQARISAPGLGGRARASNNLTIPTTGIRAALAQRLGQRIANNGGLTRLTPVRSGLLRV